MYIYDTFWDLVFFCEFCGENISDYMILWKEKIYFKVCWIEEVKKLVSLSFKKTLVSPFLYWNIRIQVIQVIFFFNQDFRMTNKQVYCISWQYIVIWSVLCDMKSFSCGNRILLQCCEYGKDLRLLWGFFMVVFGNKYMIARRCMC